MGENYSSPWGVGESSFPIKKKAITSDWGVDWTVAVDFGSMSSILTECQLGVGWHALQNCAFPINQSLSVLTLLGGGTKAQEGDLPKGKGRKYQLDVFERRRNIYWWWQPVFIFPRLWGGVTFNQGWTPDMMNIKESCEHVDVGELLCSQ